VYQVPYVPKGQHHEQTMTKGRTLPPVCASRFSSSSTSLHTGMVAARIGRMREKKANSFQVSRNIIKERVGEKKERFQEVSREEYGLGLRVRVRVRVRRN
jgi:hypothetical protein